MNELEIITHSGPGSNPKHTIYVRLLSKFHLIYLALNYDNWKWIKEAAIGQNFKLEKSLKIKAFLFFARS